MCTVGLYRGVWTLGKAYGLNTQVLLANLQHFCNNIIIILNYYYFIPGLFLSHSWWAESCSVRLSRGMVCSRQPQSFQGVHPHGRPVGFRRSFISSRRPLIVSSIPSSIATVRPASVEASLFGFTNMPSLFLYYYWPACLVPKRTPSTVRNPPP